MHLLSSDMSADMFKQAQQQYFFISGCQRSGTTLLRLILESHEKIQCFDEGIGYEILVNQGRGESVEYPVKKGAIYIGFKIPRFTEQLTNEYFVDPDYGKFPSFYKNQKVIHVVRNVLDVVSSMMKLKMAKDVSWLEKYGIEILESMLKDKNLDLKYREKHSNLRHKGYPAHLVGALYWEIKNQGYFDLLENSQCVYPLSYERLVSASEFELIKLCEFLKIEWSDALLNHFKYSHGELDEMGRAIGNTDPARAIDNCSVGSYKSMLSEQQICQIKEFTEDMSSQMNSLFQA